MFHFSNFWLTELYPGSIIWSPSTTTGFTNLVIMKLHFFHGLQNVYVGANKAPIFNGWLLCMKVLLKGLVLQLAECQVWDNYTTHLLATCVKMRVKIYSVDCFILSILIYLVSGDSYRNLGKKWCQNFTFLNKAFLWG